MTLRVAVIGYGLAGEVFHAPLVAATEGMRVAAIVTSDPARRDRAATSYPDARILSSPEEIWSDPTDFDLVVIASPNRSHAPLALRAVDAGLPVVVDKPATATVADAEAVRAAAAAKGVPVAVFHNRRWDGDFLTVARLLERGDLGPVHRFESRFERWRPEVSGAWRESADPADAGGLLYDIGSHLIDQALVLFGPVSSVYAELRCVRLGAEVDDDTFVALAHENGTVSHLWASLVAAEPRARMRVLGRAGAYATFGLDVQEGQLRTGMSPLADGFGVGPNVTERGRYDCFYGLMRDAVLDGAPVPVGIDDAIATLRIVAMAQQSAVTGQVVHTGK